MSDTYGKMVAASVAANINAYTAQQELNAAQSGVPLATETRVFIEDGSKNWATALASALCRNPALANGTTGDMAEVIKTELGLTRDFDRTRISKPLSTTAKKLVSRILTENGYAATTLAKGIDIRNIIRAGKSCAMPVECTIKTIFEVDGVWLGENWHAYERVNSYESDFPWYFLGLRFAGDLIPLKTVLAMRGIGINQFIDLDDAALKRANKEQLARRALCSVND